MRTKHEYQVKSATHNRHWPKFTSNMTDEEFVSEEFLMLVFSMLEKYGYTGFNQLQAVVDDSTVIMKILRLMHGMQFKIPSLGELSHIMNLCIYIYYYYMKDDIPLDRHVTLKDLLGFTEEQVTQYKKELDEWLFYMKANGYEISDFIPILENNRNKRNRLVDKRKFFKEMNITDIIRK